MAPESLNVVPAIENGAIRAVIAEYGHYTFMVNGDDQRYSFTLSVTEYADEDVEIAALQEKIPGEWLRRRNGI